MVNHDFVSLLRRMSAEEIRDFRKLVECRNRADKDFALVDLAIKSITTDKPDLLAKPYLLRKLYNCVERTMYRHFERMGEELFAFLVANELKYHPLMAEELLLLRQLRIHDPAAFEAPLPEQPEGTDPALYNYIVYSFLQSRYFHVAFSKFVNKDQAAGMLGQAAAHLHDFYNLSRLRLIAEAFVSSLVDGKPANQEVLTVLHSDDIRLSERDTTMVRFYKLLVIMLRDEDMDLYNDTINSFTAIAGDLSLQEAENAFYWIFSFVGVKTTASTELEDMKRLHALNILGAEKGYFGSSRTAMSYNHFISIVAAAIAVREDVWAKEVFMPEYERYLPADLKTQVLAICNAHLLIFAGYRTHNHKLLTEANKLLGDITIKVPPLTLHSYSLQIMCAYEKIKHNSHALEVVRTDCQTFKKYVQRHEAMSEVAKTRCYHFIKMVLYLSSQRCSKAGAVELFQELQPMSRASWVQEKINALKEEARSKQSS